ncbi:MAG: TRAP transporter fused permease subunit [Proteobacteria bacterium]|nr:TRAP transporter fused permease subunit [Pseudomonadota bacterium]MDA1357941.1 TRAP transporter fused permease subunit [Pseudomonadota bacterium]
MNDVSVNERKSLASQFSGEWNLLGFAVGLATTAYYMYVGTFGTFSPALDRSVFIFVGVALAICYFPLARGVAARLADAALLAAVTVATYRFNEHYLVFAETEGFDIGDFDMAMGWIMILGVIEAGRRSLGLAMAIISVAFLLFLYFGAYIPWPFVHGGFNLRQIATSLYAQTDGLYGSITYVLASNLFLFLVFGVFLVRSGASEFFTNICLSFLGTRPGGGAKAAVGASFITASISGSASANVAITGSITIPMMIRTGYRPAVAGGIEAAASTGGTIMPPVMGASAFIMVALTGFSYGTIVLYATIPALLYFLNVYLQVHFYAMRNGLRGLPAEECPPFRGTLRKGWVFLVPILVVIILVYLDYSLRRVGLLAIVSVVVASWFTDRKMGLRDIIQTMADGAKDSLPIIAIAGPVSIIAGAVLLPGTGIRITGLIIDLAESNLAFTVMFIFIVGYVLGMGLSVIPAYVILATLAAPALIQLGIPVMAAHLLVLWWGQASNVTPPVALAAYMAAGISRAPLWRVCNVAMVKAMAIFYLPVLFVYQPGLLLEGGVINVVLTVGTLALGGLAISAGIEGFFYASMGVAMRVIAIAVGTALILTHGLFAIAPLALFIGFWLWQIRSGRLAAASNSGGQSEGQ